MISLHDLQFEDINRGPQNKSFLGCGEIFSIFLSKDGRKISIIGKWMLQYEFTIQEIRIPEQIIQMQCGKKAAIFLDYYGKVYTAISECRQNTGQGAGSAFRLWLSDTIKIDSLIKTICFGVESGYLIGIDSSLWFINNHFHPSRIEDPNLTNKKIKHISCGFDHVILIMEDHSVWVRGNNEYGQLGLGHFDNSFVFTPLITDEIFISVSCGYSHSLFLTRTQNVYSCGSNEFGQLGTGLKKGDYPNLQLIEKLYLISIISCSIHSSYCIDIDGNLFTFGMNIQGELGLGDTQPRFEPEKVNGIPSIHHISNGHGNHTMIRDKKGDLWITGFHQSYALPKFTVTKFTKLDKTFSNLWTGDDSQFNSFFEEIDFKKKNFVSLYFVNKRFYLCFLLGC